MDGGNGNPRRTGQKELPALPAVRLLRILPHMASAKSSALLDTRVIYCGDNAPPSPAAVSLLSALDQLRKLPDACVDLITIDPPFNSNRNYEVFWGETKETGSFYYHCACAPVAFGLSSKIK